jgi:murein endopeptidase
MRRNHAVETKWVPSLLMLLFFQACPLRARSQEPDFSKMVLTPTCKPTRSIGLPWKGRLQCGQRLPLHPRLLPKVELLYATAETHQSILKAADYLDAFDPGGPPIEVLDLSLPDGGPIPTAHVSHQSGRDADFSFFTRPGLHPPDIYWSVAPEALDAHRTWLLLKGLLRTQQVEFILIDYELQAMLRADAEKKEEPGLEWIFQYPHGKDSRHGLIRHWPNHNSHMHVRFKCPRGHPRCQG